MPPDLEVIRGNYPAAIQSADPRTIQTAAEIQKDRLTDESLGRINLWTANVPLYGLLDGKPSLLFGGREAFVYLYVPNIQKIYSQISTPPHHIYTLHALDYEWALTEGLSSGTLVSFNLRELFDKKYTDEFGYFSFNPSKASDLSGPKRQLLELINGTGDDFLRVMEMLSQQRITESRVYGLNPEYVASLGNFRLVGLASWLGDFLSDFIADDRDVDDRGALRGERRLVPAEAGASNLEQTLNRFSATNPTAQVSAPIPEVSTQRRPKLGDHDDRFKLLELSTNDEVIMRQQRAELAEIRERYRQNPALVSPEEAALLQENSERGNASSEPIELSERFRLLELD